MKSTNSLSFRLEVIFFNQGSFFVWGLSLLLFFLSYMLMLDASIEDLYLGENSPETFGTVTKLDSITRSSKSGVQVFYKFTFQFKDHENNVFERSCYSSQKSHAVNALVTVQYYKTKPTCSRIKDTTIGVRDIYSTIFFVLILFILPFSTFVIPFITTRIKIVRFLRTAQKTTAFYTHYTQELEVKTKTKKDKLYNVYYEYTVNGVNHIHFTQTKHPEKVSIKIERTIFYNPQNPQKAIFEDEIFT